ncbi:MAG: Gfo/Idh/MocA family oxidoreductase [Armatimonadetes bacterium]|nr:Gfo/Idh/MocA family oxidoreductase [Armatimonadota bacterium]
MSHPIRAAVIGGSGFGKFHAQWYAREGAEVVAYTGTSEESAEAAGGPLRNLTGQNPKGYADAEAMLQTEHPDVVSVCTPPACHIEPAMAALKAGAHVLCEKPLLYDSELSSAETLERSAALVDVANQQSLVLAVNLQYAATLDLYRELYERVWGALETYNAYSFEMESKGNRRGAHTFEQIWIELGPHAITPLLISLPNAALVEDSLQTEMNETDVRVEMEFENPGGHRIPVQLRTGACTKDATPVRRFGFNNFRVEIEARKDESGLFTSALRHAESGKEIAGDDFMRVSVRRFLQAARGQGTPLVSGIQAQRNLAVMLAVLDRLRR